MSLAETVRHVGQAITTAPCFVRFSEYFAAHRIAHPEIQERDRALQRGVVPLVSLAGGGRVPPARPHRCRPLVHGAVPGLRRRQPRLSTRRLLSGSWSVIALYAFLLLDPLVVLGSADPGSEGLRVPESVPADHDRAQRHSLRHPDDVSVVGNDSRGLDHAAHQRLLARQRPAHPHARPDAGVRARVLCITDPPDSQGQGDRGRTSPACRHARAGGRAKRLLDQGESRAPLSLAGDRSLPRSTSSR